MSAGVKIVSVVALVIGLALGLGVGEAQAASCGNSSGDGMWTLSVSTLFQYTVKVTNRSSWGNVKLKLYDECYRIENTWYCSGHVSTSGPYSGWASVTWSPSDNDYYAWVDTNGNSYRLCLY